MKFPCGAMLHQSLSSMVFVPNSHPPSLARVCCDHPLARVDDSKSSASKMFWPREISVRKTKATRMGRRFMIGNVAKTESKLFRIESVPERKILTLL